MKPLKTVEQILAEMLENHEYELTPVHTPVTEYESVQQANSEIYQLMLSLVDGTKEVTFNGEELPEADSEWNECVNYIKQKLSEHFNGEGEV